jgi:hypothetical protein
MVLVGLLVVAIGALGYDHLVAKPAAETAEKKIQDFVDAQNKKGVRDATPVTPQEISTLLGKKPTLVEKHDDENYEIEYYCWWGPVPVLNTRRQFISVVYYGIDEPRRFSSHHRNEKPPEEALPILQQAAESGDSETVNDPESAGGGKAAEAPAPSGEEGKGITEPAPAAKDVPADKDAAAKEP